MAKIDPMNDLGGQPGREITRQPNPADEHYKNEIKKEHSKPPKRGEPPVKHYPPREGEPQTVHPLPGKRKP